MVKKKKSVDGFYITAFDQKVGRRVVFVVKNGVAKSLVSSTKFKYKRG